MSSDLKLLEAIYIELINVMDSKIILTLDDQALSEQLLAFVEHYCELNELDHPLAKNKEISQILFDELRGLGPIEILIKDPDISEVMVNGFDQIFFEKRGVIERSDITFRDDEHVMNVAQRIAHKVNRRIDGASPMVDARLLDGSRVNIVIPPVALNGPTISIRKFSRYNLTTKILLENDSISEGIAKFMEICATSRVNIIVSGGTGTGKTTVLNLLADMIPKNERVITVEDSAELRFQHPNLVRLEARMANSEGKGRINIHDLLINCLRMRPDRIIVGEVRGEEAFEMLKILNTGHDGSMSTVHSNSAHDCVYRLENMVATYNKGLPIDAIRNQIVSGIDVIFHVVRLRDGKRRIQSVIDIEKMENGKIITRPIFEFVFEEILDNQEIKGKFVPNNTMPSFYKKIEACGLMDELKKCLN